MPSHQSPLLVTQQYVEQFQRAIQQEGITPPVEVIADGAIHRFSSNGRVGDKAGWYMLFPDGVPAGSFGDWRTNAHHTWRADIGRRLTAAEEAAHASRVEEMRRTRKAEEDRRRTEARQECAALWDSATAAPDDHPYLARKQVRPCGLRVDQKGRLLVPLRVAGDLHSLQTIDGDGRKLFFPGGRVSGCYFVIGDKARADEERLLCVAEGFATAATIHAATGHTTVVAFNTGNLLPVTKDLRKRFPDYQLVLCADNDTATEGNPGLTKATEAAKAVGGALAVPEFGTDQAGSDFNDLALVHGLERVKTAIDAAKPVGDQKSAIESANNSEAVPPRTRPRRGEEGDDIRPSGYTDDAITLVFSNHHADKLRYVPEWGWVEWQGTHWNVIPDVKVFDLARVICRSVALHCSVDPTLSVHKKDALNRTILSVKTIAAVSRLACGDARHLSRSAQWDADLWLFNTPGGTIDLRTGTLRYHKQSDQITKISNSTPRGTCPLWNAFLSQVTGGSTEIQDYLRRVVGYALAGDPSEEVVIFLYGPGGNGKGTFLDAVQHAFGEYATTASMDTFTQAQGERHPTDIAKLAGKRLVVAQEVDEGKRWDEARLKSLTGRDVISARFMRKDYFDFRPQFSLLIAGNHKPALKTVDDAIRRRLHLVPFTISIPLEQRDKDLKSSLRSEADGILAWAVQGCLEWQRYGLNPPAAVLEATKNYLEDEDVLGQWLKHSCLVGPGFDEPSGALFASYRRWKESRGEHPGSQKKFSGTLSNRGFILERTSSARRIRGLRLTDEERVSVELVKQAPASPQDRAIADPAEQGEMTYDTF